MKLRAAAQCLVIGFSAFSISFVNAAPGYMSIEKFQSWVQDNEAAFTTIGEDLRWLIYLVQVDRPLYINPDKALDEDLSRSLETTLGNVQDVFEKLQLESEQPEPGVSRKKAQANKDLFFAQELANINSMITEFRINLPQGVWSNRVNDEPVEAVTPIEATKALVQQLEDSRLDLTDPLAVAMWVLDAQDIVNQRESDMTIISFNIASLRKLRQAFKSVHDGYQAIAEVINRVYNGAAEKYQGAVNQGPLFAIETPLRRLQNFMFAYQGVFAGRPSKST
ncbi:hypothetical protein TWF718_010150 [Orbilia javanica]|uniref:Uncharacterized protein n=1 Tax=Orbilia javanica TaxID=47235 RepID=A0AAN8MQM5_9PEZI